MKEIVCSNNVGNELDWDKMPFGEEKSSNKFLTVNIFKNPTRGRRLRVNVTKRTGFTNAELKRHQSAMVLVEIVVNSSEFKKRVLARKFTTTKKTAQQIYDHIMTGEEVLQKGVDYEMDADIEMYYKKNNVVGYTYPNVTTTWINRYVTSDYDEEDIAGNFFHEWLHKLGYGHSSASDKSSVPYAIGYIVRDMIEAYKAGARWVDLYPDVVVVNPPTPENPTPEVPPVVTPLPTPEPKKVCHRPWYYLGLVTVCYYEK